MSQSAEKSSFFCDVCSLPYDSESQFEEHQWSMLHQTNLEKKQSVKDHHCMLCKATCQSLSEYSVHLIKDTHRNAIYRRQQRLREQRTPQRRPGREFPRNSYQHPRHLQSSPESDNRYEQQSWRSFDQDRFYQEDYPPYNQSLFDIQIAPRGPPTPHQNPHQWHQDFHMGSQSVPRRKGKNVHHHPGGSRSSSRGKSAGRQKKKKLQDVSPGRRRQGKHAKTHRDTSSTPRHDSSQGGSYTRTAPGLKRKKTGPTTSSRGKERTQNSNEKLKKTNLNSGTKKSTDSSIGQTSKETLIAKEHGTARSVSLLSSPLNPVVSENVGEEYLLSVQEKMLHSGAPGSLLPSINDARPTEMPTINASLGQVKGIIMSKKSHDTTKDTSVERPHAVLGSTCGVSQDSSSSGNLTMVGSEVPRNPAVTQSSETLNNPDTIQMDTNTTNVQSIGQNSLLPQIIQKDIRKLVRNRLLKPNFESSRVLYHPSIHSNVAVLDLKNVLLDLFERPAPLHRRALIESQLKELFIKAGQASDRFKRFGIRLESVEPERDEMIKMLEKLTEEDMEVLYQNESQDILHEILSLFGTPDDQSAGGATKLPEGRSVADGTNTSKEVIVEPGAKEGTSITGKNCQETEAAELSGSDVEFIENDILSEVVVSSEDDLETSSMPDKDTASLPHVGIASERLLPHKNLAGTLPLSGEGHVESAMRDVGLLASSPLNDARGLNSSPREGDIRESSAPIESREELDSLHNDGGSEINPLTQASGGGTTIHRQVFKLSMAETKLREEVKEMKKEKKRIERVLQMETEKLIALQRELHEKKREMKTLQKNRRSLTREHLKKGPHQLYSLSPQKDGLATLSITPQRDSSCAVDSPMSVDTSSPGTSSVSTPTRLPVEQQPSHRKNADGDLSTASTTDITPAAVLMVQNAPDSQQLMHGTKGQPTGNNPQPITKTSKPPTKKLTSTRGKRRPRILASQGKSKKPGPAATQPTPPPAEYAVIGTVRGVAAPSRPRFRQILPKPSTDGLSSGRVIAVQKPQTDGPPSKHVPLGQVATSSDHSVPSLTVNSPEDTPSLDVPPSVGSTMVQQPVVSTALTVNSPEDTPSLDVPPSVGSTMVQQPVVSTGHPTSGPAHNYPATTPIVSLGQLSPTALPTNQSLILTSSLGSTLSQPPILSSGVVLGGSSVGSRWNPLVNIPSQFPAQIVHKSHASTLDNAGRDDLPVVSTITSGSLFPTSSVPFISQFGIPPSAMGISIQKISDEDLAKLTSSGDGELPSRQGSGMGNCFESTSRNGFPVTSDLAMSAQGTVTTSSQETVNRSLIPSSYGDHSDAPGSKKLQHQKGKKKSKKSGSNGKETEEHRKQASSSRRQSKRLSQRKRASSEGSSHGQQQDKVSSVVVEEMSNEDQSVLDKVCMGPSNFLDVRKATVVSNVADVVEVSAQQDMKSAGSAPTSLGRAFTLELLPPMIISSIEPCQSGQAPIASSSIAKLDAVLSRLPSADTSTIVQSASLESAVDHKLPGHTGSPTLQRGESCEEPAAQPPESSATASPVGRKETLDVTVSDSNQTIVGVAVVDDIVDATHTLKSNDVHSSLWGAVQETSPPEKNRMPTNCSIPFPVSIRRISAHDSPLGKELCPSSSHVDRAETQDFGMGLIPTFSTVYQNIQAKRTKPCGTGPNKLPGHPVSISRISHHDSSMEKEPGSIRKLPISRSDTPSGNKDITVKAEPNYVGPEGISTPGAGCDESQVDKTIVPVESSEQLHLPAQELCPRSSHVDRAEPQAFGTGPIIAFSKVCESIQTKRTGTESSGTGPNKPLGHQAVPVEGGVFPMSLHVSRNEYLMKEDPRENGEPIANQSSDNQTPKADGGVSQDDVLPGGKTGQLVETENVDGIDHDQVSMPAIKSEPQEGNLSTGTGLFSSPGNNEQDGGWISQESESLLEGEGSSSEFPVTHANVSLTNETLSVSEKLHCGDPSTGPFNETIKGDLPADSSIGLGRVIRTSACHSNIDPSTSTVPSLGTNSNSQLGGETTKEKNEAEALPDETEPGHPSSDFRHPGAVVHHGETEPENSSSDIQHPDAAVQHNQQLTATGNIPENASSVPSIDITADKTKGSAQIICKPLVIRLKDIGSKMKRDLPLKDSVILIEHSPTAKKISSRSNDGQIFPKHGNLKKKLGKSTGRANLKESLSKLQRKKKQMRRKKMQELLVLGLSPAYMEIHRKGSGADEIEKKVLLDEMDRLTMLKNIPPVAESGAENEAKSLSSGPRKSRNKREHEESLVGPQRTKKKKPKGDTTTLENLPKVHALSSVKKHNLSRRHYSPDAPNNISEGLVLSSKRNVAISLVKQVGESKAPPGKERLARGIMGSCKNIAVISYQAGDVSSKAATMEMEAPEGQEQTSLGMASSGKEHLLQSGAGSLVSAARTKVKLPQVVQPESLSEEEVELLRDPEGVVPNSRKNCPLQYRKQITLRINEDCEAAESFAEEGDIHQEKVQNLPLQGEGDLGKAIFGLQISKRRLYSYSKDGLARCYNKDHNAVPQYKEFDQAITCMAACKNYLFLALADGWVQAVNMQTFQCSNYFRCQPDVRSMSFLGPWDMRKTLATGSADGVINMYTTEGNLLGTLSGHLSPVLCMKSWEKLLYSADADGKFILHNCQDKRIVSVSMHRGPVTCIKLTGNLIYTASLDNLIRIFGRKRKIQLLKTIPAYDVLSFALWDDEIYIGKADGTLQTIENPMSKQFKKKLSKA